MGVTVARLGGGVGVVPGEGLGDGELVIVSVTLTVIACPDDEVIVTVALCGPADSPLGSAVNVIVEFACAASLPLVGLTVNQDADDVPACHVKPSPPLLVITIPCEDGLPEALDEKLRSVALNCIVGALILIVTGIVNGLPATA